MKRNYFLGVLVNPSRVTLAPLHHWLLDLSFLWADVGNILKFSLFHVHVGVTGSVIV